MKFRIITLIFALLACVSISRSEVTGYGDNDGSGATDCIVIWQISTPTPRITDYTMFITGNQYWAPGSILGFFDTNTAEDPTVTISSSIDNDTGFDWTQYHVNVSMDRLFSISDAIASIPGDWTASITEQPILVGSNWIGQLDYYAGTPVTNGDTLEFSYKITFGGSTHYNYTQDMLPIPEPGALALLVCGLLSLLAVRHRLAC